MALLGIQQQRAMTDSDLFRPQQTHWSFVQLGNVHQDCKRAYEKTPKNDWVIVEQPPEGFHNPSESIHSRVIGRT